MILASFKTILLVEPEACNLVIFFKGTILFLSFYFTNDLNFLIYLPFPFLHCLQITLTNIKMNIPKHAKTDINTVFSIRDKLSINSSSAFFSETVDVEFAVTVIIPLA